MNVYVDRTEIERLYRSIADGEPRRELLQMVYDLFGKTHGLRPPISEERLADRCRSAKGACRG